MRHGGGDPQYLAWEALGDYSLPGGGKDSLQETTRSCMVIILMPSLQGNDAALE